MTRAVHGRQERLRGGRVARHTVRVTGTQEARLQSLAVAQGVSVARLLVETTLASEGWTPSQRRALVAEFFRARRALAGVATNVNQIAHWANGQQQFPRDVAERVLPEIERVMERLAAAALELGSA